MERPDAYPDAAVTPTPDGMIVTFRAAQGVTGSVAVRSMTAAQLRSMGQRFIEASIQRAREDGERASREGRLDVV